RAHDGAAGDRHLGLQKTLRVALTFASEAVRADHLGEVAGDVSRGEPLGPHLVEVHPYAQAGRGQRRLATGHAGSDHRQTRFSSRHPRKSSTAWTRLPANLEP